MRDEKWVGEERRVKSNGGAKAALVMALQTVCVCCKALIKV